ncbi:MFS transporter [Shimia sp. R9_1]|uniref:MFS transporter n=1 Tax=Shimia sp. R9_1 TaxID=2821111 RepID=UPI001ADCDE0F|nr:MFS transporter [Shimia sp. R9_1]MBO9406506.1 MFS transporter [Shimia sp. R9_1]
MFEKIAIDDAQALPWWRRPIALLFLMALAMPIAFNTWSALLNNFVVELADFDGADAGLLHTVREIPGFLAVAVIFLILFIREQVLGTISLLLLGVATALTAYFPSMGGILMITLLSSIGFHYYETVNQSLQLQWLDKKRAPKVLGWLVAAGSGATLLAYGLIILSWKRFDLSYEVVYLAGGGITALIALYCIFAFPQFEGRTPQARKMVLKKRYWLYYAMQFMAGARRQIFVVFAGFMMVKHFGYEVHESTGLNMVTLVATMMFAPLVGGALSRFGERRILVFEYTGLFVVFLAYSGIFFFGWGVTLAAALFVIDHLLFSLAIGLKTYFQKIADPEDMAPTAAVAFTINHIAAVCLPFPLGLLWVYSPGSVFVLAASMAAVSLGLACLIPRHPEKGNETRLTRPLAAAAE